MTFQPAAFVDGGPINGVLLRRQYESATRSGQGVIEPGDLAVRPLDVPGTGFRIASGAAAIRGTAAFDGSYYALNLGDHQVDNVTGTGSSGPRSDMVVARVTSGAVVEPYIIQGVSPTATTVPAGFTDPAIPLARIDWPTSTGTITAEMIVDLRQMLSPRSERVLRVQRGVQPYDLGGNITTYYENWPNLVWADVTIPIWATQVQMVGHWGNLFFAAADLASGSGSTDAQGRLRLALGYGAGGGPTDLTTAPTSYNFNLNTGNAQRVQAMAADQLDIPAQMRGQNANLRMQCQGSANARGRLRADEWSSFYVDLMFLEVPTPDMGT